MFNKIKLSLGSKIVVFTTSLVAAALLLISYIQYSVFAKIVSDTPAVGTAQKGLSDDFRLYLIIASLFVVLVTIVLSFYLVRYLTQPIFSLKEYLKLTEEGILANEININSGDEIGEMASITNNIVRSLKHTAHFAHTIGEGNLNTQFKPASENDVLGNSLLNMQKNLISAEIREKERNWIVNGIAEVGEILRKHNSIDPLSYDVIKYLIGKIGAIQGAFYVIEEDDENEFKKSIVMKNLYAYNRKKYKTARFKMGDGLVGQAAIEGATIFRTEIPQDYCSITSGLIIDKKPDSILIVPLITEELTYGVVEFASLKKFSKNEVRFIEEVGPIIARTIFNIHVNERTQRHLEQSQKMSAELQQQQEELRQNAEEMRATQEDLQLSNEKLEEQIEEVNKTQKRMQSLLENASEVIAIYEKNMVLRYVSPSVKRILGINSSDLVNKKDEAHIYEEDRTAYKAMFDELLADPEKSITIQYRFIKDNGELIWLEATGKNLLSDRAVGGIILNSRDITVKRKAEMEERMRKNMQALSENSPDLITRLNCDGVITYTNPVIENYTGLKPAEFMNQSLETVSTQNGIVGVWKEILQNVISTENKLHLETNYNSHLGERVMQINAIPEYNENSLESVLVVSHDITEMKLIEREIQAKNRSIHESITYSKRIQNAIIPDNKSIQKTLPGSFILYKPRDIVSGDFPWYMEKDDSVFISVVDCTGHGVPGAMLSLVGYFQLNNIVEMCSGLNSGAILDEFDRKVNETLIKDTNEENIKDGMDIAFCKIDLSKKIVEYAGAHRSLYHVSGGELTEYKGDKWAIGGGVYKNQTQFTNHKIKMKTGDMIFFFSDGFPDQFGGPQNRKLGTVKIKDAIMNNKDKSMAAIHDALNVEFESWKGEHKQTDDVLLIGIKF